MKVFEDIELSELRNYIDWSPFFRTWDLHGRYPKILEDEVVGEEAKAFKDANKMLDDIIAEGWLTAKAVVGFFANKKGTDDTELYTDDSRSEILKLFGYIRRKQKDSKLNLLS